jgi:hypothetical protein
VLNAGEETRDSDLSLLNAFRMVCVAVPRRRRGFMGGKGGAVLGEDWADPGGRPMRGTFDVDETKVGSEICFLLTVRLRREPLPVPRSGIA